MDRKRFLITLGLIALAVTGISGTFKRLSDPEFLKPNHRKAQKRFGNGPYGG